MTTPFSRTPVRVVLVACLCALAVCLCVARCSSASAARSRAQALLAQASRDAHEVATLQRSSTPLIADPSGRPTLLSTVSVCLARAGLAPSRMLSLDPQPSARVRLPADAPPGLEATTESARLVLTTPDLPSLGRFLAELRSHAAQWTIAAIQISPDADSSALSADSSADSRISSRVLRADLLLERVTFLGDEP